MSPRQAAYNILNRYEKPAPAPTAGQPHQERRADALIDQLIEQEGGQWPVNGAGWLTHQVLTNLRYWHPTGAWMAQLTGRKLKDTPPVVRTVVRLGLTQLAHSPTTPAAAVVDETVALMRQLGGSPGQVGLVNALLRKAAALSTDERLAALARTSPWPKWLLERWTPLLTSDDDDDGKAVATTAQTLTLQQPPFGVRVNTLKQPIEAYCTQLTEAGIEWIQPLPDTVPEALVLPQGPGGGVEGLPGFAQGRVTVQDVASSTVARWVDPQGPETVVDLCAAPGSKTAHLVALMRHTSTPSHSADSSDKPTDSGHVMAVDVSAKRLERVRQNSERLGLSTQVGIELTVAVGDGTHWQPPTLVDAVMVDAPCSGLGTLRRHPEKLADLRLGDLETQQVLQVALLRHALTLVKCGTGRVIYSVCSPDPAEGLDVVATVLADPVNQRWHLDESQTLWPTTTSDGFFIARLIQR